MARLSIGEFARESGLTPKALRLYAELGLLPPVHVDPFNGYRFYERSQLERARLIVRLRVLGMPLERIRVVLDSPPRAAGAEVTSYWRQVEADTAARQEMALFLIDHFSGKDTSMVDVVEKFEMRSAGRSDKGQVLRTNEDEVFTGQRLFAVADGFGAQELCGTASLAVLEALKPLDSQSPTGEPLDVLSDAADKARAAVREFTESEGASSHVGTTLTAMLRVGNQLAVMHVGDTRAYLLRDGDLTQITHDHSVAQSLVEEGKLTPEEAASHAPRGILRRALYRDDETQELDLHQRTVQVGDRYLLCSDGLHGVVREQELTRALEEARTPEDGVDRCIELVHAAGAPDNSACLIVDVIAGE